MPVAISDSPKDNRSKSLRNEERYGFRTKPMFDRSMSVTYDRYGWTKRPYSHRSYDLFVGSQQTELALIMLSSGVCAWDGG